MALIFFAFYTGFGVLTNLLLFGAINWSAWPAWAVLLMWPALWAVIMFFVCFAIYLIIIAGATILDWIDSIGFVRRWRTRRNQARIKAMLANRGLTFS